MSDRNNLTKPVTRYRFANTLAGCVEHPEGEWVKHADMVAALQWVADRIHARIAPEPPQGHEIPFSADLQNPPEAERPAFQQAADKISGGIEADAMDWLRNQAEPAVIQLEGECQSCHQWVVLRSEPTAPLTNERSAALTEQVAADPRGAFMTAEPEAPLQMRTMRQYKLDAPYSGEIAGPDCPHSEVNPIADTHANWCVTCGAFHDGAQWIHPNRPAEPV